MGEALVPLCTILLWLLFLAALWWTFGDRIVRSRLFGAWLCLLLAEAALELFLAVEVRIGLPSPRTGPLLLPQPYSNLFRVDLCDQVDVGVGRVRLADVIDLLVTRWLLVECRRIPVSARSMTGMVLALRVSLFLGVVWYLVAMRNDSGCSKA